MGSLSNGPKPTASVLAYTWGDYLRSTPRMRPRIGSEIERVEDRSFLYCFDSVFTETTVMHW